MADTFPQTHTTSTRTTVITNKPSADVQAITTASGIIKIVEIVLSIITFICCVSGCNGHSHSGWGAFVSFTAILLAIGFLVCLIFHVHDLVPQFPLLLFEMIVLVLWTLFYLIAASCLAALSDYARWYLNVVWYGTWTCHTSAGAGAFFAFVTMLVFGVDAFLTFRRWRKQSALQSTLPARNVTTIPPAGTVITVPA